jgi:hypothetical protein
MPTETQPPRSTRRGSRTARLLALAAALGLVGCMLFAQPVRRAFLWIEAAQAHLSIDAFQRAGEKKTKSE